MKKFIYLLLFLAIGRTATAQTLSVADVEVLQGETASYALNINTGDGIYQSFQCDVQFPATGFSIPAVPNTTVNPSWSATFRQSDAMNNGAYRLSAVGLMMIPTGDIEIGTVAFTVGADTPAGEYDVTITNFEFITTTTRQRANDVTFKVKVVNTLTLDENSTEAPEAATGVNVLVKRTIAANEWGTICLPFAMNNEQVTAAFGSDVKLCEFADWSAEDDANGNITNVTITFANVDVSSGIEANHPYIIKVSNEVTQFEVENVDIVPENEPLTEVKHGNRIRDPKSSMIGTYVAETTVPDLHLFLSGGKFYYSKGLTKMKAFRAYFNIYDILTSVENGGSAGAKISMNIGGETTSIDNSQLIIDNFAEGVYDLQGRKVSTDSDLSKLKSGVYIINGKKVVKK